MPVSPTTLPLGRLAWPAWMPSWLPLALLVGSLAMLLCFPVALARLPRRHFVGGPALRRPLTPRQWIGFAVRNLVGTVLVLLGIAMLVLPGQGLLTIVLGLSLGDFPGKRRAELWLIRRPAIWSGLQRLRSFAGAEPFEPPTPD